MTRKKRSFHEGAYVVASPSCLAVAGRQGAVQRTRAPGAQRRPAARHGARPRRGRGDLRGGVPAPERRSHRRGTDRRPAGVARAGYRPGAYARGLSRARREPVTGWLLDTNILSELRRSAAEPKVRAFVASQPLDRLYERGHDRGYPVRHRTGRRSRPSLQDWLTHKVRLMFPDRGDSWWRREDIRIGRRI
jgi:hypothetical protein